MLTRAFYGRLTALGFCLSACAGAYAGDISGNVALTTDYVFRGVTQTDNQAAIQGGFDWGHESGVYLGTWASNVDSTFFRADTVPDDDGRDPQIELDLYGGWKGEVTDGLTLDFGLLQYVYPGAEDSNTLEFYAGATYSYFTVKGFYADELSFIGNDESGYYLSGNADFPLPGEFTLGLHAGWQDGDAFDESDDGIGFDIFDWSVGISRPVAGVVLSLAYTDTNADDEDELDELADGRVVFTIKKTL